MYNLIQMGSGGMFLRKLEIFILPALLIFFTASASFADQTLVVNLNPPSCASSSNPQKDIILSHQPLKSTNTKAVINQTTNNSNAATGTNQTVIGRVGMVVSVKAAIQRSPSMRAPNLYSCKKDTPLAIVSEVPGWYGVLMADSSAGWVEKKNINLLDYDIVGTQSAGSSGGYNPMGSIANAAITNISRKPICFPANRTSIIPIIVDNDAIAVNCPNRRPFFPSLARFIVIEGLIVIHACNPMLQMKDHITSEGML